MPYSSYPLNEFPLRLSQSQTKGRKNFARQILSVGIIFDPGSYVLGTINFDPGT